VSDTIAFWREAITDSAHPRHRVAWLLFGDHRTDYLVRELDAHKDELIPDLLVILDTPALYEVGALGGGDAAINAVSLLGAWRVTEATSRLLRILEEENDEPEPTAVSDRAIQALKNMGPSILEDVWQAAERAEGDWRFPLAEVLSGVGQGDTRAYEWVRALFDKQTERYDVDFTSSMLLRIDPDAAIPYLEACLSKRKYDQDAREMLRANIDYARDQAARGEEVP
jgi:hypothetical protein